MTDSDCSYMSGMNVTGSSLDVSVASVSSVRTSGRKRRMPKGDFDHPRLISLVEMHPCLWDDQHEDYLDHNAVSQAWEMVAAGMYDTTAAECRNTWKKTILKGYQQNMGRHAKTLKGSGLKGKRETPYKYAKHLSFLKRVGDLEDEIVLGPSNLKARKIRKVVHTSSPLRNDVKDDKENQTPSFDLNVSPFKSNSSPFKLSMTRSQNSQTPSIHQDSTLISKRIFKTENKNTSRKLLSPIMEEKSENLSRSPLSRQHNTMDTTTVQSSSLKHIKSSQTNPPKPTKKEVLVLRAKEMAKKRELQCIRISEKVKEEEQARQKIKNEQDAQKKPISKPTPIPIGLEDKDILEKLLAEEDRFMYSVLAVVQPLRSMPLPKSRKVLLDITKLVFEAEEEVEEEAEEKRKTNKVHTISQEDENLMNEYLEKPAESQIPDTLFNMTILVVDLQSLKPGIWINDQVINYYLALLRSECNSVYALSTFFYLEMKDPNRGYPFAKKETGKIDIFSFNRVLVPIHKTNHWVLAVMDMENRIFRFYDSMNGQDIHCPSILLKFLEDEHLNRKKVPLESYLWSAQHMDVSEHRQENGSDCGVFVCKYAESEARGTPLAFSQHQMPLFRKQLMLSLLKGKIFTG